MTGRDLKAIRIKLLGDRHGAIKRKASKLETPYRTYQSWEAQKGSIPGVASVAVRGVERLTEIESKST